MTEEKGRSAYFLDSHCRGCSVLMVLIVTNNPFPVIIYQFFPQSTGTLLSDCEVYPASYPIRTGTSFLGGKTDRCLVSSAEV